MTMTTPSRPAATRRPTGLVGEIFAVWNDLARALFDSYRPERHYMRGPGPAWRAKHGRELRVVVTGGLPHTALRPIPALVGVRR